VFTGIIEEIGVASSTTSGRLCIRCTAIQSGLALGESIAVDGVDLTVAALDATSFTANVMPETYRRSTLGARRPGDRVNLERAVLPTTRLSGHLVRGVVEGIAQLETVRPDSDALIFRFSARHDLLDHIIVKGPIAIDGASFTVIERDDNGFAISVVAYSQTHTTITDRRVGDKVNIETDIIARYVDAVVVRLLATKSR
jgi:riboflavin synthase